MDLAQYREMEVFTQFSSELDDKTKAQLNYGRSLMELLKQPLGHPISMADQVITLVAATNRAFSDMPVEEIKSYQGEMLDFIHRVHPEIVNELNSSKKLEDTLRDDIIKATEEFKESRKGAGVSEAQAEPQEAEPEKAAEKETAKEESES